MPEIHVDLNAEEIQGPGRGQRIRRPPPCGTSQRLGKKKVVY
jgi:hypothetical protein